MHKISNCSDVDEYKKYNHICEGCRLYDEYSKIKNISDAMTNFEREVNLKMMSIQTSINAHAVGLQNVYKELKQLEERILQTKKIKELE